jgi:GT2 family glycosyltransferase
MTGIIILNWNGASDTIECLKSLYNAKGEHCND